MNTNKDGGFKKGEKGEGVANKGSTTKPIQGQPNAMEARFARLKALVISMATQVKSTTSRPGRPRIEKMANHMVQIILWD
jgi:hypothetical protein